MSWINPNLGTALVTLAMGAGAYIFGRVLYESAQCCWSRSENAVDKRQQTRKGAASDDYSWNRSYSRHL